jgi:hypothetical protein
MELVLKRTMTMSTVMEETESLLHSLREQISTFHDQFKRTIEMSPIQGQMGSVLHN